MVSNFSAAAAHVAIFCACFALALRGKEALKSDKELNFKNGGTTKAREGTLQASRVIPDQNFLFIP